MFQNSGRAGFLIRSEDSQLESTKIIRVLAAPHGRVLQESWSINSILGRISEPWVYKAMETPYIVQRPFETATATIRLDRLLIVVWWTHKNPVDDHPTYDCTLGEVTRSSKTLPSTDFLMMNGAEIPVTYRLVALIIHMRKSRGNISASTRSGYVEGREKWWRHPQHPNYGSSRFKFS